MEPALGLGPAHKTPTPEPAAEAWLLKAFVKSWNLQEVSESGKRRVPESLHAASVRCSAWLGVDDCQARSDLSDLLAGAILLIHVDRRELGFHPGPQRRSWLVPLCSRPLAVETAPLAPSACVEVRGHR